MNKDKRNNIQLLGTLNNADESGIIANANQIYDANEDKSTQDVSKEHTERIKDLEAKDDAMQTTLENITKTGEASAASNVTYNHSDSKLDATNVQQAVDEIRELINTHEGNIEELQDSVNEINQEIQVTDNGLDDFSIQDEAGNILCLWKDGHIKTKNFLSSTLNQVIFDSTYQTTNKANYGTIEDLDQALTPGIFLWKQDGKQAGIVQCFLDNLNHALTQILCTNYQLTDSDNNILNFTKIVDKDSAKKGTFSSHQHTIHTYVRTYGYTDDFADNQSSAQKLEKGWSGWVGLLLDSEWYSNLKLICKSWFKDFSDITIEDGPDDFSIQDEAGNVLCLWKDGHIKTKNFDSQSVGGKVESDSDHIKFKATNGKGYEQHEYVKKSIPTISFVTPLRYCNASDAAASYTPTTNKFAAAIIAVTSQDVVTIPYLMGIALDTTDSAYATQGTGDYPITLGLYDSAQKLIGVLDKTTIAQTNKVIDFRKELTLVKSSTTSTYILTAGSTYYLYIQTQANSSSVTDSSTTDDYVNACKNQINAITIESHVLKDIRAIDANSVDIVDSSNSFDFDIEDENQNILVGLKDGHIKTKNFDSKETLQVIDGLKNENENSKTSLKILLIGNSISVDAFMDFPYFMKQIYGITDIEFTGFFWGGQTFQGYSNVLTSTSAMSGCKYTWNKSKFRWIQTWNSTSFTSLVQNTDFNFVILQPYFRGSLTSNNNSNTPDQAIKILNRISELRNDKSGFSFIIHTPISFYKQTTAVYDSWYSDFISKIPYCWMRIPSYNFINNLFELEGLDSTKFSADGTNSLKTSDGILISPEGTHAQIGFIRAILSMLVCECFATKLKIPSKLLYNKYIISQTDYISLNPFDVANTTPTFQEGTQEWYYKAQKEIIKTIKNYSNI